MPTYSSEFQQDAQTRNQTAWANGVSLAFVNGGIRVSVARKISPMKTPTRDYSSLIDRIKAGDDGAMSQLIKQYGPTMERIAEQMVGRLLQAHVDAQDIVQAVSVTLWLGIQTETFHVPSPDHLLALAKTLLSRQVARHWRMLKNEVAVKVDSSLADTVPDRDLSAAFKEAEIVRVDELLNKFLAQMDAVEQRLVTMRFHGRTTAEAAKELGLDPGFLRVRLGRLRQRLGKLWDQIESNA
jgi:RNA polymerase sigma-70 factor (ECF subfamily)